jgi:adenylate cyclase
MHAELVNRLVKSGAAVIAFDIMFPEPASKEEDDAFAKAISAAGNVVLAADHAYHETAYTRQWLRMDPVIQFTKAGATTGLATMSLDQDTVVRKMAEADDAFWKETVRTLIRSRPGSVVEPYVAPGAMLRHLGPSHTFPYISYYQVLNGDPSIPPDFFSDQMVLIGRDVRASPESGAAQADTFATPFMITTNLLTPGVEIHATQIENALMGQTIRPASKGINLGLLSAVLLLALPLLAFWHPVRSTLLALLIGCGILGVAYWCFISSNLWLATATPLTGLAVSFITTSTGSFLIERRRAGDIRAAFAKYVSSEVVNEMIAHPERLTLGGQRREVTVLFCDLAGFTTLSEKLSPDAVAQVINLYLNAMTRIIMEKSGTVDKFIGDAVMAFWGAPLDDDEHALHATLSAIEMQKAMQELQPEFHKFGLDSVALRIGLNSGPAIIGNMGSDLRFDYTAIGDSVNLASRLEGVNKAYGTSILLSKSTADLVKDGIQLRPVDRVRVKGKDVPVDIFTPCDDMHLVVLTGLAWADYLERNWPKAMEHWAEVRKVSPDDSLASIYEQRISSYQESPPDEGWDGSLALEKL